MVMEPLFSGRSSLARAGRQRASRPRKLIAEGELLDAQAQMTPEQYAQQYLCSFDAAILGAYYGKEIAQLEREGRVTKVERVPDVPVYTAWDLGISDNGRAALMASYAAAVIEIVTIRPELAHQRRASVGRGRRPKAPIECPTPPLNAALEACQLLQAVINVAIMHLTEL